jgi:Flp pilus assembly CpaE family ATPase
MSGKIKLYIVDIEETTVNRLEEVFYKHPQLGFKVIGNAHNYVSCINDIDQAKTADIILVSAYLPDQMGFDLIEKLKKVNPTAKVVIMVTKQTRNLAEVSREKGADEIIQKPFQVGNLVEKIESLLEPGKISEARQGISEESGDASVSLHKNEDKGRKMFEEPTILSGFSHDEYDDDKKPKVVSVFYSTGSNGKTTILSNVAAAIQKYSEYKPKICILDLNLQFPSVLNKFHQDDLIMCKKNIFDIVEDMTHLDQALLYSALVTHEPTGIKIMNTPSDVIRDYSRISADDIEQLIAHLKDYFDVILIDTSSNIRDDTTSFPLTIADKSFILLEPDISSVLHTRKFIQMMKVFESNIQEKITSKFIYVLNKENSKTGIHVEDVKKALFNNDIRVRIPYDVNVTFFSNNGQFVIDNSTPSAKYINDLAKMIYPFKDGFDLSGDKKKSKSLFAPLLDLLKKRK